MVPGNVYGHGTDPVAVEVDADVLSAVVHTGHRVLDLEIAGAKDKAILRELQWDAFGQSIEHFDVLRVDPNETVKVDVPLELKGTAPGAVAGGILEQPLHALHIDCLAYQIPDSIHVRIGSLEVGQAIHVRDLQLPEGVHTSVNGDTIVVHIVQPKTREAEAAVAAPGEPEVVGKKAAEGDAKADAKDTKKK